MSDYDAYKIDVTFCIKRKGRQMTALYYFSVTFNTSSLIAARSRSRVFVL